jgi:hypothetical protein
MRNHCTPVRMARLEQDCPAVQFSHTSGGNAKSHGIFGKQRATA